MSRSGNLDRRSFLGVTLASGAALAFGRGLAVNQTVAVEEATLSHLQALMQAGTLSSRGLTERYLARIRALDQAGPRLNAIIEVNPEALAMARELDSERRLKGPRGPLHGIPVLLKDNIETAGPMASTAGSLALRGALAPRDAFVAQRLREAGAVLLGKTNLSEWANFRSTHSVSGWSGRGGQTRNPYVLDRNPSGSSSGSAVAVAANLCAVAVGTETDGSIVSPASSCGIVGLKPTLGLISRAGIIPLAHSQDSAGPMARSVRDAAILLGLLAGPEPRDPATDAARGHVLTDYTLGLNSDALKGARLGVVRAWSAQNAGTDDLFEQALGVLRSQGAILVDPAQLGPTKAYEEAEQTVLLYEFKADLNAYLAARGGPADLAAIIAFNEAHRAQEMPFFGQELLLQAQAKGPLTDAAYLKALAQCRSAREDIDSLLDKHGLDALVAPTGGPACLIDVVLGDAGLWCCSTPAAVAGYPHLTVPAGQVAGLPVGLSFFGRAWSESLLLNLGYAFEQASGHRRPPTYLATAPLNPVHGRRG